MAATPSAQVHFSQVTYTEDLQYLQEQKITTEVRSALALQSLELQAPCC